MSDAGLSVTALLQDWSGGDESALEKLTPLVYSALRRVAASYMKRERPGHTLQPTELVHEAFLRLVGQESPDYRNRGHFLAIAAQHMRQILVDHARRRARVKHGGAAQRITMELVSIAAPGSPVDFLVLNEALTALAEFDERKSRVLEMHFFGGMGQGEIATVLGVHTNTVARDLRLARAWLQSRLRS